MGISSTLIHAAIKLLEQALDTIGPLEEIKVDLEIIGTIAMLGRLLDESQPKLQEDLGFE